MKADDQRCAEGNNERTDQRDELEQTGCHTKEKGVRHAYQNESERAEHADEETGQQRCVCPARIYLSRIRWEAILTTCVLSSVSHASTRMASASEHPSLTAASCVADVACGALGMTLMSCSRTALECETRTSPGFMSDNNCVLVSFATTSVWRVLAICAVPFRT